MRERRIHRRGALRPVSGRPDIIEIIPVCGMKGRVVVTSDPAGVTCVRCNELTPASGQRRIELAQLAEGLL